MSKQLDDIVACQRKNDHKHFCDKTYSTMPKVCKYNGDKIQVPVYKDGVRGYSLRYECRKYKK